MSIQTFLKRPLGLLRIPGNIRTVYRPDRVRVSGCKPCVGSTVIDYAVLQTQPRLCMFGTTNIRHFALLPYPHQVHSATTMHRLGTQQTRRLSTWGHDYPKKRHIEVKTKGKNADWEKVKAIVTLHRCTHHRARRVWTPDPGYRPTKKNLAVHWPEEKQAIVLRKLRDAEQASRDKDYWDKDEKDFYTVTEKLGRDGRLFWREVISKGEWPEEQKPFVGKLRAMKITGIKTRKRSKRSRRSWDRIDDLS